MWVFIAIVVLSANASATFSGFGGISSGASVSSRLDDGRGNYKFGYNEKHSTGGSFRSESGNAYGGVTGSYGLVDADGRQRIVTYVADANGFRASIKTNEPGTIPNSPAATTIGSGNLLGGTPGVYTHSSVLPSSIGAPLSYSTRITHAGSPVVTHHASALPVPTAPINFNTYSTASRRFREVTPLGGYAGGAPLLPVSPPSPPRVTPLSYSSQVTHHVPIAAGAPAPSLFNPHVSSVRSPIAPSHISYPIPTTYSSRIAHVNPVATPTSYSSSITHAAAPVLPPLFKQVAPVPLNAPPVYQTPGVSFRAPAIAGPVSYSSQVSHSAAAAHVQRYQYYS